MIKRTDISRAAGFTLIELLVVIAILSLLITILIPSLADVQSIARRTYCRTNMRTIMVAIAQYASEENGMIVPHWINPGEYGYEDGEWYANMLVRGGHINAKNGADIPASEDRGPFRCPEGTDKYMEWIDPNGDSNRRPEHFSWYYRFADADGSNMTEIDGLAVRSWYAPNSGNHGDMPTWSWCHEGRPFKKMSDLGRTSELVGLLETPMPNAFWGGARIGARHTPYTHGKQQGWTNIGFFDCHVSGVDTSTLNSRYNGGTDPRNLYQDTIFSLSKL